MGNWLVPFEVVGALAVLGLLGALGIIVRRFWLFRRNGTFDCSVRIPPRGWSIGVARYEIAELHWYAFFSFRRGPSRVWNRRELTMRGLATPTVVDQLATMPQVVIIQCGHAGQDIDFGLSPDVATGFSSWIESAPPGLNEAVY